MIIKKLADFIKENKIVFCFFVLSTLFFILQHYFHLSWDLSVYISNAKYWFSNGNYFETIRPPLASVIIGMLSLFKFYGFGKYAFIVLSSVLYFFMCIKLADKLKINRILFYALCLNVYVLFWGLSVGTEILALALLGLFVPYLIENRNAGIILGLTPILRYQAAPLSILLLFYKKPSKIMLNCIYFAIPSALWLLFNYIATGNPLTAIADSYAQNVLARQAVSKPFNILHVLSAANIMLIPIIYYIFRLKETSFRRNEFKEWKTSAVMLIVAAITIYTYAQTPNKEMRYLFNLTLPFAYFSSKALNKFNVKKIGTILGYSFLIIMFAVFSFAYPFLGIDALRFDKNIQDLSQIGIKNCSIRSDVWPLLGYYGFSANFNRAELTDKYIENNEYLVLFPRYGEYKYEEFNENIIIKRTEDYFVLGNKSIKCKEAKPVYHSFLLGYNETLFLSRNESADINPYNILFKKACC